ncbi:hypothetical protein ABK040_014043 [Willaertia magna]
MKSNKKNNSTNNPTNKGNASLATFYSKIQDHNQIDNLVKQPFHTSSYQYWNNFYQQENNVDALKSMRIYVMKDTLQSIQRGYYYFSTKDDDKDLTKIKIRTLEEKEIYDKQLKRNIFYKFNERDNLNEYLNNFLNNNTLITDNIDEENVQSSTILLNQDNVKVDNTTQNGNKPLIRIVNSDCVDVLIDLIINKNRNPVILNMASRKRPGGGHETGQPSQEEALFRVTNYIQSFSSEIYTKFNKKNFSNNILQQNENIFEGNLNPNDFYPFPEFGVIYSPNVLLFRHGEESGFRFLSNPIEIAIIASSAYIRPTTVTVSSGSSGASTSSSSSKKKKQGGSSSNAKSGKAKKEEKELTSKFREGTIQKIKTILIAAIKNNHDSIVLSAYGSGAYKNPPKCVAKCFYQVIVKEGFGKYFKEIVFAILDSDKTGVCKKEGKNYGAYMEVFKEVLSK